MSSQANQSELQAPAPAMLSSKSPIMESQQPRLAMQMGMFIQFPVPFIARFFIFYMARQIAELTSYRS